MSTTLNHFVPINQIDIAPENTVVLVGTALDGPANTPFMLHNDIDPYEALGQSPLADAYYAAQQTGAVSIVGYRLNGSHATALIKDKNGKELLELRSLSASDAYNGIQVVLYPDHIYTVSTEGEPRNYFFDRYKTVYELVYAMNQDAFYGLVEFTAESIDAYYTFSTLVDMPTTVIFSGGTTEEHLITRRDSLSINHNDAVSIVAQLKERVGIALFGQDADDIRNREVNSDLGMLHCGVVTLCDMYHDDDPELTEMLGSFCQNKTEEVGYGCVGVIGTRPIFPEEPNEELGEVDAPSLDVTIKNRVNDLIALTQSLEDKEVYKYVQVIVGHTTFPKSEGESVSIASTYAATQAQLPYYSMMSNKHMTGVGKLNFEINKEDIALLTANGYTCIVPSIRRGFVPYYASSYSKDKAALMSKPHCLRISQYVSRILAEEMDGLIGESVITLSIQDAIERAEELLDGLVINNVLRDYTLTYELLNNNTVLNIETSLTPLSEIQSVNSIATVSFPQGAIV